MRIASLVPSATETLFALGLGEQVVAVTHECDFPEQALEAAQLTRSVLPEGLGPAEIDAAVRDRTDGGQAIYELDGELLIELEPDLIVTQALCEVCAVSVDDVRAVAERMSPPPLVLPLDPTTLGEVMTDIRTVADAAGVPAQGDALLAELADRIEVVASAVAAGERPAVAALEWLDPPFIGGHWVPQLIDLAGGIDVLGLPGERSRTAEWSDLEAAQPEIVVCMPCGYDAERSAQEAFAYEDRLDALEARAVFAVDASAYFSRPGPRLVDGLELLAALLHPELTGPPLPGRSVALSL
ncbi:MAG: cobalamin-binding protein [Thermoleophilaceae bacterium]|nr:cobalamin-binding protein [Thermoleophilaceae bacterium]